MSRAETQRLRKEIHVQVIEQVHSWGTFQNQQVFSWDENMEQPWGLGPSHMAALHRANAAPCHGWSGTPSFSAPQARRQVKCFFLEGLKWQWCFLFLPALHSTVGKHSFTRFSCRVAWVCGNTGPIALHRQSLKCCLSLCFLHAGTALQQHCGLKFLFCSQECQNYDSQVGAAFGHVFVYTSCCSVQIQKNFCSSGPKFYSIQCFQH